ncbi:MAG: hypothetical protein HAW67_03805 [Endozoicomonadaceae bacterium]|nr:hypothetical protein [Endozoicomonadaceae bacterium]
MSIHTERANKLNKELTQLDKRRNIVLNLINKAHQDHIQHIKLRRQARSAKSKMRQV